MSSTPSEKQIEDEVHTESVSKSTLEKNSTLTSNKKYSSSSSARSISDDESVDKEDTMTKSRLKKVRRRDRLVEKRKHKKEQDKLARIEKAKASGRDLELERKIQEEQRLAGHGKRRRDEEWKINKLPLAQKSFQVCIDCDFEPSMHRKEINSLATQIRHCYAINKRNVHPCILALTSIGGETLEHLKNVSGFEEWHNRAFTCTADSLESFYEDRLQDVVYLTSDSDQVLEDLDDNKIYVIGGIVDRNRLKRAAINRARQINVTTARLPINEYLAKLDATRVLTCNHVFEILLKYRENDKDWKKALLDVLPRRKDAKGKEDQ